MSEQLSCRVDLHSCVVLLTSSTHAYCIRLEEQAYFTSSTPLS
jgi:hypothetical protein